MYFLPFCNSNINIIYLDSHIQSIMYSRVCLLACLFTNALKHIFCKHTHTQTHKQREKHECELNRVTSTIIHCIFPWNSYSLTHWMHKSASCIIFAWYDQIHTHHTTKIFNTHFHLIRWLNSRFVCSVRWCWNMQWNQHIIHETSKVCLHVHSLTSQIYILLWWYEQVSGVKFWRATPLF